MTTPSALSDHHIHKCVSFGRDSLEFYRASVNFYHTLLKADIEVVSHDEDLKAILGEDVIASFPITKEKGRAARVLDWLNVLMAKGGTDTFDFDIDVSHGTVRFIKSTVALYLGHLRIRRQSIATRPTVSMAILEMVDQQIARLEEKITLGVFCSATPYPLLVSQIQPAEIPDRSTAPKESRVATDTMPRPVILDTIEIRDPELRKRCLDLLSQFKEDGQHDRLDTVVTEATRILEDRLRLLSAAPATSIGVELARFAFSGKTPRLIVSEIESEQEATFLFFRGVIGSVRNSVHHRLVETYQPERVLQIVGMVDYMISIAEASRREISTSDSSKGTVDPK